MARSVDVPVIADADTGYGNELNVTRTVREFEARGRGRHPRGGPGVAQALRPPRRQGGGLPPGVRLQDPRRRRGPEQPRLRGHRPDRRPGRDRPRRRDRAGQRRPRRRRRRGLRRGHPDDGRGGRGARAGARTVPAQRRARWPDSGPRPAPSRGDGLPLGHSARADDQRSHSGRRRRAGRAQGDPQPSPPVGERWLARSGASARRSGTASASASTPALPPPSPRWLDDRHRRRRPHAVRQALGRPRGARAGRRLGAAARRPPSPPRPVGAAGPGRRWPPGACRCTTPSSSSPRPTTRSPAAPAGTAPPIPWAAASGRRCSGGRPGPACGCSIWGSPVRASCT